MESILDRWWDIGVPLHSSNKKSGNTWKHCTSPTAKEFKVCHSVFCNAAGLSHVKFMRQGTRSNVNTRFDTPTSVSGYLRPGHQS